MNQTTVVRTIAAPLERVFATIADIRSFQRAIPHIIDIEFLSPARTGVGTRFRETRRINGRDSTTELEVTECVANDRIRMVADSHGTIWDSLFAVREVREGTELTLTMEARPHQLMARLTTPVVLPAVRGAIEKDLELVKRYCESGDESGDPAGDPPGGPAAGGW